jgi:hypothetical protein
MRPLLLITLWSIVLVHPPGLGAQTSTVRGPPAQLTAEMAKQLLESMADDLRRLVTAQEQYFARNSRYGHALSNSDHNQVYIVPSPGVSLTLTYVTTGTWAARANHQWLRWSCVIIIGPVAPTRIPKTTVGGFAPTEAGEPICDTP